MKMIVFVAGSYLQSRTSERVVSVISIHDSVHFVNVLSRPGFFFFLSDLKIQRYVAL